jgi:hypothetical protein
VYSWSVLRSEIHTPVITTHGSSADCFRIFKHAEMAELFVQPQRLIKR